MTQGATKWLLGIVMLGQLGLHWPIAPDVPAIHYPVESHWEWEAGPGDRMSCSHHGVPKESPKPAGVIFWHDDCTDGWEWTCADKSRILLTAEDGKKWCHKPETEPR